MARARPKQHTRKVSTKKGKRKVTVNKGVKKVKVKSFKRGKHKVKGYTRRHRKLGKKITFKEVGKFMVGHDELGNVRGSKIVITKKKKETPKKTRVKRKRLQDSLIDNLKQVDTEYFVGDIKYPEWIKRRKNILG